MKREIHGNTAGIRDVLLEEMEQLYDLEQQPGVFASPALLESLAIYTGRIGREISVYISRGGRIEDVSIGDDRTVSMPDMRLVRNIDRLCGVRCVHTHPNGVGCLSDVDLGTLNSMRLDAMCSLAVLDGKPGAFYASYVGERKNEERVPVILGPMSPYKLPHQLLLDHISIADDLLRTPAAEVTANEPERAILVGVDKNAGYDTMSELAALADTAGVKVVASESQKKRVLDSATYIGSGKADELRLLSSALEADVFIFDDELSAIQIRNLEEILATPVIDRTMLILDIFARRAVTREGRIQVELAQLKYRLPRLMGSTGLTLSRQGSGVGARGPGEKKLEIDRRRIRRRIYELEQELKEIESQRALRRAHRKDNALPVVALVGYTNAGKSTLLNAISNASVLAENKLFATLDPVVRQLTLPGGTACLLTDTVGFINKLPTDLVEAFRSTLEEVVEANLILHVVDSASDYCDTQMHVVEEIITSLGAGNTPRLTVLNKCDESSAHAFERGETVIISAKTGAGLDLLLDKIERRLNGEYKEVEVFIPYAKYDLMQFVRTSGTILSEEHGTEGTMLTAKLKEADIGRINSLLNGR